MKANWKMATLRTGDLTEIACAPTVQNRKETLIYKNNNSILGAYM